MSNNNDTNFNFEQFLSQEAEKYRAYPSDKVWNNIRTEMHGKKRWPALIFCFVFVMLAATISTVLFYPPHKEYFVQYKEPSTRAKKQGQQVCKNYSNIVATISSSDITEKTNKIFVSELVHKKEQGCRIDFFSNTTKNNYANINNNNIITNKQAISTPEKIEKTLAESDIKTNTEPKITDAESSSLTKKLISESEKNNTQEIAKFTNTTPVITSKKNSARKLQLQFYVAPSVSYRVLDDDKSRANYTNNPSDLQALKSNVNDVVHHKPAFGTEVGVALMYPITKNFFVKTGLQFNSSQYIVDASQQSGQANISFVENNKLNTISYQAKYSTQQGVNNVILDNKVYQLSIPVGIQWNFIDNARWGLAFGATIQPTITLNKNIYLVSTDYKFYTDGAPFFRKANVNTTTELLLTLKSKTNKWIFGPQVRYQQMPTYNDLYPVKEYRVDYGIKVGFIKSL